MKNLWGGGTILWVGGEEVGGFGHLFSPKEQTLTFLFFFFGWGVLEHSVVGGWGRVDEPGGQLIAN